MFNQKTHENSEQLVEEEVSIKYAYKVILFNDDWHSFDEVIAQIMKAIHCNREKAISLTTQVHNMGKAVVFQGELQQCLKVSSVLEEIALHTQIES